MAGFIKLLIYLIIIAFWVISTAKKRSRWEEKIPDFPEDFTPPPPKPKAPPQHEEPLREGALDYETPAPTPTYEKTKRSYDEVLAQRRKKFQTVRDKRQVKKVQPPPPVKPSPPLAKPQVKEPAFPATEEVKQPLTLKSSVKEGIMWSIILGPPRSKLQFDWKNPPIRR